MLASFEHSASGASVGAGNPYPVSNYTCQDGTRLAVRLIGVDAAGGELPPSRYAAGADWYGNAGRLEKLAKR